MGCCTGYNFAPTPDAALDPNQRVNFTFGMVLGVDDFRQEHAFLAARDARALRELIGYGAITGLEVRTDASGAQVEVRVAPGLALLPDGKLVGVAVDQCARLDEWLAGPGRGAAPASGPASVYIVLRHVEVSGTPVPIPGEPCRDERSLLADARIADSFTLDFSWTPPAQTEDAALRTFAAWLRRVEIRTAPAVPITLPEFQAAVETQVTAAIAHAQAAFANPPLHETPAPQPDPASGGGATSPAGPELVIPREHSAAYLNAAFDVWVRRLRAGAMAHFGPVPAAEAGAEAGLLLAAIDIRLDAGSLHLPPAPASPAAVRWLGRAQLVHLRLLQEWLLTSIENDAPVDADYVLGRADPRLPRAQDLAAEFASADHALARVDLVPAPTSADPGAVKALLRPAVKWPGTPSSPVSPVSPVSPDAAPPDYYGPGMSAPIPVGDGGTGQGAEPAQGQLLVGVAGAPATPAGFALGALRAQEHPLPDGTLAPNLRVDVAGAAPDILLDTIQPIGPGDSPAFAALDVRGLTSSGSLTLANPLAIGSGGTGQGALPQRLQVLVGDQDGDASRFVLARLTDSETVSVTLQQLAGGDWQILFNAPVGGGIEVPLPVSQGGTGQANAPTPGQILTGQIDASGNFATGDLRPARPGRHIQVTQAGQDLVIDTTPQAHWATRIVDEPFGRLDEEDHVVFLTNQSEAVRFELGEPEDQRVVVIKNSAPRTISVLVFALEGGGPELFIDLLPELRLEPLQSVTLIGNEPLRRWFVIGRG